MTQREKKLVAVLDAARGLLQQMANVGAHQCVGWDCSFCRSGSLGWRDLEVAVGEADKVQSYDKQRDEDLAAARAEGNKLDKVGGTQ